MARVAIDVDDSTERLAERVAAQRAKPGFALDAYFYQSPRVYHKELDEILYKSWLYAGHVSEVPNPGDYFLYELGEDSIIVVRDQGGAVHALMNICRHRGSRVCEAAQGNRASFVCPYHGWTYNLDGSLKAARAMEVKPEFEPASYGLKTARCVVYEGLIFVNMDPQAANFEAALRTIEPALRPYRLPSAKIAHRQVYAVEANWKLVLENYQECYHCATAHRAYAKLHTIERLEGEVQDITASMLERAERQTGVPGITHAHYQAYGASAGFGTCVYTSRYALYDGYLTGSEGGQPVAPLMGEFKGYDGGAGDFQIGPLAFMLNYPDHCVLYRFTPRSLTSTDMELVWFLRGDAEEGRDYDRGAVTWLWDRTTREDEYIISRNSAGVNSRFFEPGPYHPEFESLCLDFVDWYLDALEQPQ
ncbi:MAG: aromatic ring-hydroxylating dioxygenase subunit alpha [Gammaproteobacteria bacterium]|nr:aromatic ring-hydroxylating dioxygenase subunit alpha [Gammaproteobacteria bacterium]